MATADLSYVRELLAAAGVPYRIEGNAFRSSCPVDGCTGELMISLNGRGEVMECTAGTPKDAIKAALVKLAEASMASDPGVHAARLYDAYEVTWTDERTPKLVLPGVPAPDDLRGLATWLTSVLQLDHQHPVTGAAHQGLRGQDGHVVIHRADARDIRFEPAASLMTARRLLPILTWQLLPTDREPYGFKDEHARRIAHVLRLLCGAAEQATEAEETAAIVATYLQSAELIEGLTTYGTGAQRYEAARALRRMLNPHTGGPGGPPRYLVDASTGELVIRVSDLQDAARRHTGSSLPRGWLDGRMADLGWQRRRIDGRAVDGRAGRHSDHVRVDVYRGHMPAEEAGEETTEGGSE
jgi:hypothetical protein